MALSVCLIGRNNIGTIRRCLESVAAIADQIVYVDTGSTDGTVSIVQEFTDDIIFHKWENDFAKARNIGLSFAIHEWILWVDTDDEVPFESQEKIRRLAAAPRKIESYVFTCTNKGVARPELVEWECFPQLRMFPNVPTIRFEGKMHENVYQKIIEMGLNVVNMPDVEIYHWGYADRAVLDEKVRRNIRIIMQNIRKWPVMARYYEFEYDGFSWFYTPKVLACWKGLKFVGEVDPFDGDPAPGNVLDLEDRLWDKAKIQASIYHLREEVMA